MSSKPIRFEIVYVARGGVIRRTKSTATTDIGRRVALRTVQDRASRIIEAVIHVSGTPSLWAEAANFFADQSVPCRMKLDHWYREMRVCRRTGEVV